MNLPFLISKWLIFSSTLSGIILVSFADLNTSSLLNYQNNLDSSTSTLASTYGYGNAESVSYKTQSNTKTEYKKQMEKVFWRDGTIKDNGGEEWGTRNSYSSSDNQGNYISLYCDVDTYYLGNLRSVTIKDSSYDLSNLTFEEMRKAQENRAGLKNGEYLVASYIKENCPSVETRKVLSSSDSAVELTSSQSIPIASGTYQVFNNNISINFN